MKKQGKGSQMTDHKVGGNIEIHICDRGFVLRIYKEFLEIKKTNNPI